MKNVNILLMVLSICLLASCYSKPKENVVAEEVVAIKDVEDVAEILDGGMGDMPKRDTLLLADGECKVFLYEVDRSVYDSLYHIYYKEQKPATAIFSLDSITAELKKIGVELTTLNSEEGMLQYLVYEGDTVVGYNDDYVGIEAYYPDYHILHLEGGHSTEMGHHVLTGQSIDELGNPATQSYSPLKKFRLSGIYNGQECSSRILQEIEGGKMTKIDLDEETYWQELCWCFNIFWVDDNTFYYSWCYDLNSQSANESKYFKVTIE